LTFHRSVVSDIDWELLFRYLGGDCDADEQRRVDDWLAEPGHRATIDAAAVAAEHVLRRIPAAAPLHIAAADRRSTRQRKVRVLAVAAAVLVAAAGLRAWRTAATNPDRADRSRPTKVAATGSGQRAVLRLADGTRVMLGVASSLRYPVAFAGQSRDVSLSGEGYFEVAHDGRRPFRVHANGATVEDIGTSFGIRAYDTDSVVGVVVAEGIVAFSAAAGIRGQRTRLHAGQRGRLAKGAIAPAVDTVDVTASLGWTQGRLEFDATPLPEVLAELERWYDVRLRIGDPSLARRRLTASFTSASRADVLSAIAVALDVQYTRAADTLVLVPAPHAR
jgi:transmembrane sensor